MARARFYHKMMPKLVVWSRASEDSSPGHAAAIFDVALPVVFQDGLLTIRTRCRPTACSSSKKIGMAGRRERKEIAGAASSDNRHEKLLPVPARLQFAELPGQPRLETFVLPSHSVVDTRSGLGGILSPPADETGLKQN